MKGQRFRETSRILSSIAGFEVAVEVETWFRVGGTEFLFEAVGQGLNQGRVLFGDVAEFAGVLAAVVEAYDAAWGWFSVR